MKNPRLDRLNNQNSLQNATVDQRNAQEGLILVFARLEEILEAGMLFHLLHGNRPNLFRYQSRQPFVNSHAQTADTLGSKADRCRQHQVRAIRFQQVRGTNIRLTSPRDERDHIHQSLGRFAAVVRQIADLVECENVGVVRSRLARVLKLLVVLVHPESRNRHGQNRTHEPGPLPPSL